jgi:hypothetical protein
MMQGLMGYADTARLHPRRHRLDALTVAWKDQSRAIGAKRHGAISVIQSRRQTLDIRRKP